MLENRKLISICSDYYSCRKRGKTQDNVDKSDNQTNKKGNYEVANTKINVKEYSEVDLYDCAKELFDFYTDIQVFTQKMVVFEIVKYVLFTKSERTLIATMSNPELLISNRFRLIIF